MKEKTYLRYHSQALINSDTFLRDQVRIVCEILQGLRTADVINEAMTQILP